MKLEIDQEDLKLIWSDVLESLEIMRAFANGDVPKSDVKKLAKNGSRRLTSARDKLGKLTGMEV